MNDYPTTQCDQMIHTDEGRTRCENKPTNQVHIHHGFTSEEKGTCQKTVILLCDQHVTDIQMEIHGQRSLHWLLGHTVCGTCNQEIVLDDIGKVQPINLSNKDNQ